MTRDVILQTGYCVLRQLGRNAHLGGRTLFTWEVTLWCYQELVCFHKLVTAVWWHLIALYLWLDDEAIVFFSSPKDRPHLHWEMLAICQGVCQPRQHGG